MKKVLNSFIDRLSKETGYNYDILVDMYNEAMDNGISVPDFIDLTLDGVLYD